MPLSKTGPDRKTWRVTIDVGEETHRLLRAHTREAGVSVQAFGEEAILAALSSSALAPSFYFAGPDDLGFQHLDEFLSGASEAIFLGTTLASVCRNDRFVDQLRMMAASGCRLTFLTIDPDLKQDHPIVGAITDVRGPRSSLVTTELKETILFCRELYRLALDSGYRDSVQAWVTQSVPTLGLVITDPLQRTSRMRMSLYVRKYPNECNPAIHLSLTESSGRNAYDTLYRHFEHTMRDARRMDLARD